MLTDGLLVAVACGEVRVDVALGLVDELGAGCAGCVDVEELGAGADVDSDACADVEESELDGPEEDLDDVEDDSVDDADTVGLSACDEVFPAQADVPNNVSPATRTTIVRCMTLLH